MFSPARDFPLALGAGRLVKDDDETIIGSVIGGYWLNNDYAKNFKLRHLSDFRNREIIFYSKEEGVTGMSIEDPEVKKKIIAYVSHASSLIQEGRSGDLLNIEGTDYVITNYLLSSPDEVYGGALLLTPLPGSLLLRSMIVSGCIAFLFFLSLLGLEKVSLRRVLWFNTKPRHAFLILLSLFVFFMVWTGIYSHGLMSTMYLSKPEITIYNSTMKLRPSSAVYALGHEQHVAVVLYSGGEPINAVEARFRFDPAKIRVDRISLDRSVCSQDMVLRKRIDNTSGVVVIACVVAGGMFDDVRGVVGDITFTPLQEGGTSIMFDEGSHVLASDGLATDVLRSVTSGFYRVFSNDQFLKTITPKSLVIPYSLSHGNSSKWYNTRRIHLAWSAIGDAHYAYELSEDPSETISENASVTSADEIILNAPHDGVFYFKIAPRSNGITGLSAVLKIQIDATPPESPRIKASTVAVKKDDIVRFELSSEDALSGLQKNFYVRSGTSAWLPTFSKLYMPFSEKGNHIIRVRVFDNAENFSESQITVKVGN